MNFVLKPYNEIGRLQFGMSREDVISILGKPISELMYGYPVKNKYLDDYGFFHVLCSECLKFDAIELFPDMTDEEIILIYDDFQIYLSIDINKTLQEISRITDDMLMDDDKEGYSSQKLGIRIYCPDEQIEEVLIHDIHYYD